MDVTTFLEHLKRQPFYQDQLVHLEQIPRRSAKYGVLRSSLHPALQRQLSQTQGIDRLFTHQAEAVNAALAGRHVIVVTGTASGKTLCYNLPVLEAILERPAARALYLYPTKALAQDQLRALEELGCTVEGRPGRGASPLPVTIGTYDGDTPQARRGRLRQHGQIILTNPDMLHVGILPNHALWGSFFRNLRFVVVDEAHTYRGIFGSQVACVLRRLRRVCALYGSEPQFIATSATIANPAQHFAALTAVEAVVVDDDGSPIGPRTFALWNPPFVDKAKTSRRSANSEATNLFTSLVRNDTRTIAFTRARKVAELILRYAREELSKSRCTKSRSGVEWRGVQKWQVQGAGGKLHAGGLEGRSGAPPPGYESRVYGSTPRASPPIAPDTRRSSAGRSSAICLAGSCWGWPRRTHWSWGSTWVGWMPRCSWGIRARSPAFGSRQGAPAAAPSRRLRC